MFMFILYRFIGKSLSMIRRKFIILSVSLLFCFNLFSQNRISNNHIGFHALGGLNISTLMGDDVSDANSRLSFALGFGIDWQFDEKWSFSPELIYSRQGFKSDIVGLIENETGIMPVVLEEDVVFSQDYLLVPLKIHFRPIKEFHLFAGPQIGVLINEDVSTDNFREDEIINDAAPIYFAGLIGAGYNFNDNVGIRASYQFGLSRTFKDLEINDSFLGINETIETKAFHSVFNIAFVYTLNNL